MRKYFGAAAMIVFLMALALALWGGVRDFSESPISSIPSILIDYDLNETDQNETAIFVHGLNDFQYTNMTIKITNETTTFERTKYDAYFLYYNTSMANFTINITVWNKNKEYTFNGSVQVASPHDAPKVLTIYEERKDRIITYTINNGNLPWKRLMERVR